jgi:hypothetical protein
MRKTIIGPFQDFLLGMPERQRRGPTMITLEVMSPSQHFADPSHRKKTLRKRLYAILKKKKAEQHGMNE